MSEDAGHGNAHFIVKVNGTHVGGIETVSALQSTGNSNVFVLTGDWGTAQQDVQIQFVNDPHGGTATADRDLYVNSIGYDGTTYANTTATVLPGSTGSFAVGGTTPTASAPADTLTLQLSEDAWKGNADFTLSIDGKQVSQPQAVTALHSAGALEDFSFAGNFGAGSHTIGITFTNDAYGGTPSTDRNLYVGGAQINGNSISSGTTALMSDGTASFTFVTTH